MEEPGTNLHSSIVAQLPSFIFKMQRSKREIKPSLSYSGPDRSISMDDINQAIALRSRRYRIVRLGDFLKELDLTEGRAIGIPTIQNELRRNGSGRAKLRTDEGRTFFLIDIPCNPDFVGQDVNRVEDKMNLQKIREVMLSIMSQLVPSLYQVDSYAELPDNQFLNKFFANIRTKSDNDCLKSMESLSDIRVLDKVVKEIFTL